MIILVAVPLLLSGLLSVTVRPLARQLRPGLAVPLVTALSLTAALCTGLVLSATAVLASAQLEPFPRLGQWSAAALRSRSELPLPLGLIAVLVVTLCLASAASRAAQSLRSLWLARRASTGMRPVAGNLVLLQEQAAVAYSLAGAGGRIVVSTGMFAALSAPERRVLLAHESAHLRHRHHLYLHLVRLAAAANPLLRPAVGAVRVATERWADEEAAAEVGDRHLTAQALGHAALAGAHTARHSHALAATEHAVIDRVQMLLRPPPARRPAAVAAATTAALLSWGAAAVVTVWANDVVQMAESVYVHR
jgi:beta-lactamase regulating signal transducer with metallopeptidase domain